MRKMALAQSIITEYGIPWAINRALYGCKLRILRALPLSDRLFETKKDTTVRRLTVFSFDIRAIADFLRTLPDEARASLLDIADHACEGKIPGFSSIVLDYGYPIDWQLNPLTGKTCDATIKWFEIPDFDSKRGDIKVIWEASRFTHFYALSRAFLLTGNDKYYGAFSLQLSQWLKANPYSFGANYKCGQECALRLINGLIAYTVFQKAGMTSAADEENIKALISCCYRKILSNFFYARRCIRNNHTISELAGMMIGAWCCGDERQVRKAYNLLDKVICEQFSTDGGYTQFSFNYQRLALQDIECVMSLHTGHRLSAEAVERVKESALLMYQCQSKSGDVPNYGSNDGALIFPVTSCGYRDFRPVIHCIHALTAGSRLYPEGPYDEELLWFAGGIDRYPVMNQQRQSRHYPDAGLYTIRNGQSFAMTVLNDYRTRPAHMDQLHLDLWVDGINVFCDSGTYSYAGEPGMELAATGGHNTVKVNGLEQMNKCGTFMLCGWTKRAGVDWSADSFRGTMASVNGYQHRREVKAFDGGFEVNDEIMTGKQDRAAVAILFHTPCEVEKTDAGIALLHQGRRICLISSDGAQTEVVAAERSLYYLSREPMHVIRIIGKPLHGKSKVKTKIEIDGWNSND